VSVVDTIERVVDETDTVFGPSVSILDTGAAFFGEGAVLVEIRAARRKRSRSPYSCDAPSVAGKPPLGRAAGAFAPRSEAREATGVPPPSPT
jgi:hypothetical protein